MECVPGVLSSPTGTLAGAPIIMIGSGYLLHDSILHSLGITPKN